MNAKDIIQQLGLQAHPEGGYYAETYRSAELVTNRNGQRRNTSTAIYFLLEKNDRSHFHRIQSDELWFFHQGQALEIVTLDDTGANSIILGNAIDKGEVLQAMIPANTWFGSKVKEGVGYSLVSCTVAPGFDFADFELAGREELVRQFPQLKTIIEEFTRQT